MCDAHSGLSPLTGFKIYSVPRVLPTDKAAKNKHLGLYLTKYI